MSMIDLSISKRTVLLPQSSQARILYSLSRTAIQDRAIREIKSRAIAEASSSMTISETTLDRMMVKYSEQLVFDPRREIENWFAYTEGAFLEPGYPPLFYYRKKNRKPSPNKSAVAAIGEGIAGFLAQRVYHCRKLARPNHDYPDIVMEAAGSTFLVEAKATVTNSPKAAIEENLLRFVANTISAAQNDLRPVKGLLVSTGIESESQFSCEYVEIQILP